MSAENRKQRLRRLDLLFAPSPIYFITACTENRRRILDSKVVHESFLLFANQGPENGAWVGRYVLMPDHVHLFVATDREKITLDKWMK